MYALNRAFDTLIGVVVALLVDILIAPIKGSEAKDGEEDAPDEI